MNNRRKFNTTKEIVEYTLGKKMKKSALGGFKCTEVYRHLQELHEIYGAFISEQLEDKERELEEQRVLLRKYEKSLQKEKDRNEQLQAKSQVVSAEYERQAHGVVTPAEDSLELDGIQIEKRRLAALLQEVEIGLDEANLKIRTLNEKLI